MSALITTIKEVQTLLKPYTADQKKLSDCIKHLAWLFFLYYQPSSVILERVRTFCLDQCDFDPDALPEGADQKLCAQLRRCINQRDSVSGSTQSGAADDISRFYGGLLTLLAEQRPKSGLFDTPASVAHFMIEVLKPVAGETIYDPAAGACGLLVEAYGAGNMLGTAFCGCEIDPDAALLGVMNLALHNIDIAGLRCQDALAIDIASKDTVITASTQLSLFSNKEEPVGIESIRHLPENGRHTGESMECVDVILTHLPFHKDKARSTQGKPKSTLQSTDLRGLNYNGSFLKKCMQTLKKEGNGRCAIVMQRSALEHTSSAHIKLRQTLFSEFTLQMIIRLPPRTFGRVSDNDTFLLFFAANRPKCRQETLRYDLPLKSGPVQAKDLEPVLEFWPQWRDYLAGKAQRPDIERSDSLWIESYSDLQGEADQAVPPDNRSSANPYRLIRPRFREALVPVDPKTLIERLLEQTQELQQAALKLRELLSQGGEQA